MLQVQSIFVPRIYQRVTRFKAEKNLTNGQFIANLFRKYIFSKGYKGEGNTKSYEKLLQ